MDDSLPTEVPTPTAPTVIPAQQIIAAIRDTVAAAVKQELAPIHERLLQVETKKNIISRIHDRLRGYRTLIIGMFITVVPSLADYVGGLDVQKLWGITPQTSAILGALVLVLRVVTKGPVPALKQDNT
jgi:hypothetical protein